MNPMTMHYENYRPCSDLEKDIVCFVVQQYSEGNMDQVFHYHAPRHRLSSTNRQSCLKSLVSRYYDRGYGMSGDWIIESHFNARIGGPINPKLFVTRISYPEPGVLRTYVGTNTVAWMDEVIDEVDFLKGRENTNAH